MHYELAADQLTRLCDPRHLPFESTADVAPLSGIVGQARALTALRFGLDMQGEGFNIYVAGVPGTGRTTTVEGFLQELAGTRPPPPDWCYVHNFADPYCPKAIRLAHGQGRRFVQEMQSFVREVRTRLPIAFEEDAYAQKREEIQRLVHQERQDILSRLSQSVQQAGFIVQVTPQGLNLMPALEGRPMTQDEYSAQKDEERQQLLNTRVALEPQVTAALRQVQQAETRGRVQLAALDQELAHGVLHPLVQELKAKFLPSADVQSYLDKVQEDILEHLGRFAPGEERPDESSAGAGSKPDQTSTLRVYEVNAVVDNGELRGAPVLSELNLTYTNLFGRIERQAEFGLMTTDFTMIKAGVLHHANGGYLVLPIEQVLANPHTWDALKRAMRSRLIVIEDSADRLATVPVKSMRPDPIPLDTKVILIGDPAYYQMLYAMDQDFSELFKVKVEFDLFMDRTPDNVGAYASFVHSLCVKEDLRQLTRDAVARVVEYGSRLAEDQNRLSTHFGRVADLLREASHYAGHDNAALVEPFHIERAVVEKARRSDLLQQRLQGAVARGQMLIATKGLVVGQVNALSVLGVGDYAFGFPARVTATVGLGREGVLDINREAELGGRIHTKGVLILGGYLAGKYAQDKAITLSARLVFEQSYDETEGDSASGAELVALLSALSDLPIHQAIAVTGSVSQHGELQAIGAVNEKIEGFFDLCQLRGLSGDQGVLIPASNVQSLMLKRSVVQAVEQGLFHIFAVNTVDEAMEILTGVAAGERGPDGRFPDGTMNERVDGRLTRLFYDLHKVEGKGQAAWT